MTKWLNNLERQWKHINHFCLLVGAFSPVNHEGLITSGLRETFIKRCTVERTSKAEIGPEEQSEKAESCWDNLWKKNAVKRVINDNDNNNR